MGVSAMRDEVLLLGRILFSLVFLGSGIGHLTQTEGSAQYAAYKKVPSPKLAVQLSGVLMALGALAVMLGIWMDLAGLCLAILVLIMAFLMHRFWEESDPQTKQVEMAQFMKNVSIAGAGLIIAAIGWGASYTITDGVFSP
jgi:putative oxidoreductase